MNKCCLHAGPKCRDFPPLSHESEAIFGAEILDMTGPCQNDKVARPSLGIHHCTSDSFLYCISWLSSTVVSLIKVC